MPKEYIDRDAVIKKIKEIYCTDCNNYNEVRCRACQIDDALNCIDDFPVADVAPVVHGEWSEGIYPFCNVCSHCGVVIDRTCIKMRIGALNYCPNCGAKMDLKPEVRLTGMKDEYKDYGVVKINNEEK